MKDAKAITEEELADHLFKCADKIRGLVDPAQYKTYILPLVFYKVIDDTYQDKYEEKMEEIENEELAKDEAFHRFQVPDEYRYEKALEQTDRLDEFLNEAFEALEEANPEKLENVFRADYIGAEGIDHDTLHELLTHLNTRNMSLEEVRPDILGEAYMDLVRDFAEEEGKDGGQFFTPRGIIQTMVGILDPQEEAKVYDPTVGSAGMLVEMAEHYRNKDGHDPKQDLILKGQESNPGVAPLARMNIFLHDLNGEIAREDSLAKPQFTEDGELETFDYVLANPPFSADWKKDKCKDDKYGRFEWGMARADRADYAFIQHMIHSLNDDGQLACVVPHGVLFRKHESKFRKGMLEGEGEKFDGNIVEAIIGLPENLFQNVGIPSALLIVNRDKPEKRKDEVLFVNAADEDFYKEKSSQNELTSEGIQTIVEKYRNWETEERVSRVVDLEEIRENDYNLNIALYVDTTEPEEDIKVTEELQKLHQLQEERQEIENQMQEHMEALNYE
jgi:type I restriction enzyme M protein